VPKLEQVARLAKPDTILAWYRQLVAEKFDGCKKGPRLLTFGRTGKEQSLAFCNTGGEDVNGDGLSDLVLSFRDAIDRISVR
jgi:hypothetical protein